MRIVVERPRAGQAGAYPEQLMVLRTVVFRDDPGMLGPRPHDRNVAAQTVYELRQLIQLDPPQPSAEWEHARVSSGRDDARRLDLIDMHRAQLVHREAAAVPARQARPIENRPFAGEADGQGGQSENRADNDQGKPREQYVERAFDHGTAHAAD